MTTIAQTVAGSLLKVSASLPATYDYTGFVALSYTTVAEVTDLGTGLGRKYALVTHTPVGNRQTYKFKGNYNSGSLAIKLARATATTTDAGQTIMIAAAASDADYSFEILAQDGTKFYFAGKVMEFLADFGTVNNLLMGSATIEVTTDIVEHT